MLSLVLALVCLSEFSTALGAAKRSTLQNAKFHELGLNGNYRHCVNSKDVSLLHTDEALEYTDITPTLDVSLNEANGTVRFDVELFYLPRDAYYIVSVGSECRSRKPHDPDTEVENIEERSQYWGHAPNSLYRDALSNPAQFGAYYVRPETGWSVRANGCSHVVYSAEFRFDELVTRCGVDFAEEANGHVRVLASLVNVQLVELDAVVRSTDWPAPFYLYVDDHDSVALVHALPGAPGERHVNALLRSISVDPRNSLGLILQTQQSKQEASNLKLGAIFAHGSEPSFELDIGEEAEDEAYVVDNSKVVQNWHLMSHEPGELFDGDFTLHFCAQNSGNCAKHLYDYSLRLLLRVANGDSREHFSADKKLHSEISQHLQVESDESVFSGEYESGSRACMQTYVIGPAPVTEKLLLELEESWLCVDADPLAPTDELVCPSAKHSVLLYSANASRPASPRAAELGVTVHQPGTYGPMSAAVCFNVSALFRDDQHVSLVRPEQRYESRVRINAAQFRISAHRFVHSAHMFSMLDAVNKTEVSVLGFASLQDSQSLQSGPFSRYNLQKSLQTARAGSLLSERHAHMFSVTPTERHLHNINDSDATAALAAIFVTLVCFIGVIVVLCIGSVRTGTARFFTRQSGTKAPLRRRKDFFL